MGFFSHPKLNLTGCVRKIDKSSTTEKSKKKKKQPSRFNFVGNHSFPNFATL